MYLDLRSLALGRVFIGVILIVDWFYRLGSAFDFYTDLGVMPRGPLIGELSNPYFFSIFHMAGKPVYIYILFAFGLIAYLGFTVGYKTKLSNLLSWIFFVSLSARIPILSHAGDDLMRLGLFWFLFLPAHRFYSLDAALKDAKFGPQMRPPTILNVASLALMLQLLAMYIFTAILKFHPIWHTEASAIYYALQLDQFLTWFGDLFKLFPYRLLQVLTWLVWVAELVLPYLFFVKWRNSKLRWIMVVAFIGFHFGLFSVFNLGFFPWVCIAYWLIFIPSSMWKDIETKNKAQQEGIKIYYDPDCGICRRVCFLIREILGLKFVSIVVGAEKEIHQKILDNNSWLIKTKEKTFLTQFDAFIYLVSNSRWSFFVFFLTIPFIRSFGNTLYEVVAKNRKKYLGWLSLFKPFKNPELTAWPFQILVVIFVVVALIWNIALFNKDGDSKIPRPIFAVGSIFRLHQHWTMFAPFPSMEDGWVITDGTLFNGEHWDIFNDHAVKFETPLKMSNMFKNTMWRKYLINIRQSDYEKYRLYFGRYLCRLWNDNHEGKEQVDTFKIYYMLDESKPRGTPKAPPVQEMLWSHGCFVK